MITLDLQLTLFLLITLLVLAAGGAVWLDRRLRARRSELPALEDAPFGMVRFDPDGKIASANPAAQRLLQVDAAPAEAWGRRLLDDPNTRHGRYRLLPLPSDRWLRVWTSADGALALLFDATDQQRGAQASQRLLHDLGHELRTPLATILTHAEVQGLPGVADVTRAESLYMLKQETQRAVRLVNDMLELGRLETGADVALRPLDLLPVAEAAMQQTMPQAANQQMPLTLEADTPLPAVAGDADALRRVLLNLLDNAVKYCRPGDRVTLSLRAEAGGVRCTVSDTGPGIAAEHLPFLTQRFYRAAPPEQAGSGLGLALVQEILRRHGSTLHISSHTEGAAAGTQMGFVLPLAVRMEAAS